VFLSALPKNRVERFCKKVDKNSETDCFSISFNHIFNRFSVRKVKKHHKSIEKKTDPGSFLPLTHPPTTGVTKFLVAPCGSYLVLFALCTRRGS
jgi:hypothetical protein